MRGVLVIGSILAAAFIGGAAQASCVEGRQSVSYERDTINDDTVMVVRTCVNGSYMTAEERAAYVYNPSGKCVEGRKTTSFEYDTNQDHQRMVTRTCVNGSYMTDAEKAAYWAAVGKTKRGCTEGHEKFVDNYFGGDLYREYLKCSGGRYKVIDRQLIKQDSGN